MLCSKDNKKNEDIVKTKKCEHDECTKQSSYNTKGSKARFCAEHKKDGMVNVRSKQCEHDGCTIHPNFNIKGSKCGRFCAEHKQNNMIDVKNKRCEHNECTKRPSFDITGGKGRFCELHKTKDMVNVVNKRCKHEGCTKMNPAFNTKNGKGLYCIEHKKEGMVNVLVYKHCDHDGCTKHPNFDVMGGKGMFCVEHKKEGMLDVRHKQCDHDGCTKRPNFDTEGGRGRFCAEHQKKGMVDVRHPRCKHDGCTTRPTFNVEGEKALFCVDHKKEGMVNVVSKRCLTCPIILKNRALKSYCYRCFIHTFPDNDIVKNHKTKERHVADFIRANFPEYNISFDKCIEGGCSKRRPDIFIDIATHVVIIEIDENQHDTYDCSCENKRLMELFMDVGGNRPIVMVRFNPDGYKTYNNKRVSSCWGISKDKGLCIVKKDKQTEWLYRLDILKDTVRSVCMEGAKKEVDVVHLFYDEVLQSS